jgi:nanoRNase/pAp phosphatase (c-di-AMP/oligoRNAs hydrolase)
MRLVTRSDFDGLACAALLEELGMVDDYLFVHPKDVQDGKIEVTSNDILTNVPFVPGCGLWFDHHSSEEERLAAQEASYRGASVHAPSCARVVYQYFDGDTKLKKFEANGLMDAVDRCDSGNLNQDEILHPKGWILLSFIMDPRTGLGRFKDYRISNYALMKDMIKYCRTMGIDQILENPDVQERVVRYHQQEADYWVMLQQNFRMDDKVLVIDLRKVEEIQSGNRFVEYALYPDANVSVRILWGREKKNVVCSVGYSILNRTCKVDVGSLMLHYGGGGHPQVGTCQLEAGAADKAIAEIIEALKEG